MDPYEVGRTLGAADPRKILQLQRFSGFSGVLFQTLWLFPPGLIAEEH